MQLGCCEQQYKPERIVELLVTKLTPNGIMIVNISLLQKELHSAERRISELKETSASREKEIKQAIEHASCEQRRLIEARNQLQNGLDQVSANASELRTTLCGAEEKIACLEARLQASEQARKELDHKLAAIHTSLRRLIGYRQDQHPVSRQRRLDAQSPEKSGYAPKNPAITQQQCKKPGKFGLLVSGYLLSNPCSTNCESLVPRSRD
ncbi:unnamed protein product [Dicrocoelium dendriticum]|nr:unnamed protein product [Dicrocoelium dendriticum]